MTDKQLKDWMERFFDAELTVDEERELYRYLCANEVSAELRKDREVILALYSIAEEDIELPEGAVERLEAMLDGLEAMKNEVQILPNSPSVHSERSLQRIASMASRAERGECSALHDGVVGARRAGALQAKRVETPHQFLYARSFTTFRMTKVLLRAACAAAVVAAVFMVIPYGKNKHTEEATVLAMVDDVDKDTFDNPEEAMQCLMAAYEDIMFAMNTARDNTREVHQALTQSVMTNLNLLKLEPTKNREL
jgi:hypothetical protein